MGAQRSIVQRASVLMGAWSEQHTSPRTDQYRNVVEERSMSGSQRFVEESHSWAGVKRTSIYFKRTTVQDVILPPSRPDEPVLAIPMKTAHDVEAQRGCSHCAFP